MALMDISKLLKVMVEHLASDLYITVESEPMYRINGLVRPAGHKKLDADETEALARGIMSDKQQAEFDNTNEVNLGLFYPDFGRFRVNVMRQRGTVALVIRQIKAEPPSFEDVALPSVLKDIALTKRGLVLIVGATGSGKSTTLAAMIDYRNSHTTGHIISIEDPIEFSHQHKKSIISQREVGLDTQSYHIALKNALRQAPDVVLIGEIRDTETMEAALTFAETGHLCLATLHSNNANQALERVMNFFPVERHKQIYMQLSLRAIVSQRLVKSESGQQVAAVEILLDSPRVKDLICKAQITELKEAMEKGEAVGMQTFDHHLFELYRNKTISLEEALRNADSQNNLRLRIKLEEKGSNFGAKQEVVNNDQKAVNVSTETTIIQDDLALRLDN
jgi:twitching motility protein PilU